jgi:hypothetical protein
VKTACIFDWSDGLPVLSQVTKQVTKQVTSKVDYGVDDLNRKKYGLVHSKVNWGDLVWYSGKNPAKSHQ